MCNPIIVGGTGGSGTRGVIAFLEECGMKPPERVNIAHDIRLPESSLFELMNRVIEETESMWFELDELSPKTLKLFQDLLVEMIQVSQPPGSSSRWGFKAPNTMFLLPLFAASFPQSCFVHVIRDGRDMAYSARSRQMSLFDHFFCNPNQNQPSFLKQALFWQKTNLELYEKGRVYMKDRYHMVKIEDLLEPKTRVQAAEKLLKGLKMGNVTETTQFATAMNVFSVSLGGTHRTEVELEDTYGKWRREPIDQIRTLETNLLRSLRAFGYKLTTIVPKRV